MSEPSFEIVFENPEKNIVDDDVFKTTIGDEDVSTTATKEKETRTRSTTVNVFGDERSRPNSEEFFVTKPSSRRRSLDVADMRITRSRSNLVRVPLETTPLKQNVRESYTPPGTPPFLRDTTDDAWADS